MRGTGALVAICGVIIGNTAVIMIGVVIFLFNPVRRTR